MTHEQVSCMMGKPTKRDTIIYWSTTGIVCCVMVFSIINFVFNDHFPFPNGKEGAFVHLGLPNYFKIELTIAKILGVLALLIPNVPTKIKEFAYFGFGITLLSAGIAHFARGDAELSILFVIDPLIFLGILAVSYWYFIKRILHATSWHSQDGPQSRPGAGAQAIHEAHAAGNSDALKA